VIEVPVSQVGPAAGRLYQPQLDELIEAVLDRYFDFGSSG
jgi:hypothetical protein